MQTGKGAYTTYVDNIRTTDKVAKIVELYKQGKSMAEIHELGVASKSYIRATITIWGGLNDN